MLLTFLLACADQSQGPKDVSETTTTNEPVIGVGIPQCAPYRDNPDTFGYCIYKYAGGIPTAGEVNRVCAEAGTWEKDCRHAWVSGRMTNKSDYSTDTLLEMCAGNPDCTFELLDFRPEEDVIKQNGYCEKYVQKYARDCIGHAMQRWWYTKPSAEQMLEVMSTPSLHPDKVVFYVAANVACNKVGSCDGLPRLKNVCQRTVKLFEKSPNRCPKQERQLMKHNMPQQGLNHRPHGRQGQTKGGNAPGQKQPAANQRGTQRQATPPPN